MAWTEQCKVAFEFGVRAKLKQGLNKTKAIQELSQESEIPYHTLRRWNYEKQQNSTKTDTTPINSGNNSINNIESETFLCEICKINPARNGKKQCQSCASKSTRQNKYIWIQQKGGHIRSLIKQLRKEAELSKKWSDGISKAEYQEVMKDVFALINIWKELSDGIKAKD